MAYFDELNLDLQDRIVSILRKKVTENREHRRNARELRVDFQDYIDEIVDD